MSNSSHLSVSAQEALQLTDAERIYRIKSDRWIGYPFAKDVMKLLDDLLQHPRVNRMPNIVLVGDTNNGKSTLVKRFCQQNPASDNPNGDAVVAPVMYIQAPPVPDEGRFYNAILDSLFAPYKPSERVDKKQFQVLKLLRYAQLKILVVDEIHQILAGSTHRQRAFLNVLKYLSNELQISIVAVGTKDALRALQTEPQLANRFRPIQIPRWRLDADFKRLLASFEAVLPLREPSGLTQETIASRLYAMSEGYIGELSGVLTLAAERAILTGTEQITLSSLDQINWTPPSDRRRQFMTG
ncbi:TniB family NTP-binding protein [Rheinheimera sp.]|uniref:TniB family NTP-binding protein n=1 Tax=Rheinheimera sp. TaxID=1869214 RepID=UPI002FDD7147